MARNPFAVLNVSENVTQNELFDAYKAMRDQYVSKRFAPGEEGAEACKRLQEIEEAYNDACDILRSRYEIHEEPQSDLNEVERLIKDKNFDAAQNLLDSDHNRTAQWHYLQSAVFYGKGWISDSFKQLEFACDMEPNNKKYRDAKENMYRKMYANSGNNNASFYGDNRGEHEGRTYSRPVGNGRGDTNTACNCCSSLICADCCCECLGGDLISCC